LLIADGSGLVVDVARMVQGFFISWFILALLLNSLYFCAAYAVWSTRELLLLLPEPPSPVCLKPSQTGPVLSPITSRRQHLSGLPPIPSRRQQLLGEDDAISLWQWHRRQPLAVERRWTSDIGIGLLAVEEDYASSLWHEEARFQRS
jgi:hypothetical protein